jgi:glutaminyl-tRNA synthetase
MENMEYQSANFIEDIIVEDLKSGKHKKIITRFPPEPNGYLHIGHAKAVCINFGIKQKFGGECNLRFDDTNPSKEDIEYINAIKEDIAWLGFSWDRECYASDYFEEMYNRAVLLIKKGLAYVCDMSAEEISAARGTLTTPGTNSPYRNRSIEENLDLFRRMREGEFKDGEKCLRAKIDMAAGNINMRDPVIYRILRAEHPHTGNKWLIYPIYDFAHPLEDAIEKITHSLCSLEFEDHRPLYDWFTENCEFSPRPRQIEFARLNLTRAVMSKRYLKKLVDDGIVDGWNDPRLYTLSGMRARGYPPEAIRDFCARIGVAKSNSEVDSAILQHCVREYLNVHATRAMVVLRPLKLIIDNYPEGKTEEIFIENNPQNPDAGTHKATFSRELYIERDDFALNPPPKFHRLMPDGMVRLKGAYIVKYSGVDLGANGEVSAVHCEYIEDSKSGGANAGIKVKGTIHFVDAKNALDVTLNMYEDLILDGDGDFAERINPNSHVILHSKAERFLQSAKAGDRFQFLRQGYFIKTQKENQYNSIVDLKDSYKAPN